jgi:hypothetical protein
MRVTVMGGILPLLVAWSVPGGTGNEGVVGVREVWEGEHVQLYREALAASGAGSVARTLTVYSRGGAVSGREAERVETASLLLPDDWGAVEGVDDRATALTMFANLPDISYSVADWAMGNERCPLDYSAVDVDPNLCFYFRGWMGALNSSHFPPQSHRAYSWYHDIAL